jgi:DnaJ-class molecular chaperone
MSDDWKKRKELRKKEYLKQHGKKLIICGACNGSGRYDHNGSPPCGLCQGTGKMRES